MKNRLDQCPRCGGKKIIKYEDSIECLECNLEFENKDILNTPDLSLVLAIQEKTGIIDILDDEDEEV